GVQSTLSVRVNELEWHETRHLVMAGAADRCFATRTDNEGKTTVVFGDGMHGARPATGVGNIKTSYRNGIGKSGNVHAGQVSLLATKPLGVKQVINPLRASGGVDAETRDQARRNVPLAVLALDRLVSVRDYADFARHFGGVGKALAVKRGNRLQLTIAGAGNAPIDSSADLYRNLLQALQRYGDPALPLSLGVCRPRALTLSAQVGLAANYAWESVEPVLRATLLDAFGFERRALAQNVYLSEVIGCIQAVRGVAWVNVDDVGSLDEDALVTSLARVASGDDQADTGSMNDDMATFRRCAEMVAAQPAALDNVGHWRSAQLLCLSPDVPDTLLLQEATR
ncbi:MAG: baseplate J/gp47 family protein, partial [Rhodanobacter sp.]